jgi:hypothetical protein
LKTITIPFWLGEDVMIDGDLPSKIISIEFSQDEATPIYQCHWWEERKSNSEWFPAWRISNKAKQ